MNEQLSKIENWEITAKKETEPKGREVDVYLFRHAEAAEQGVETELTGRGIEQAKEAATSLISQIQEQGGGVIKFLSSPVKRAKQTSEIMQQTIAAALIEQEIDNIRLIIPRDREALRAPGVVGPLARQGIEDPIEYWFANPDVLPGKNPEQIAERLRELLGLLKKVADRLPPGEKIHYVGVTHEVPQAALLHQLSGKTLNELGGSVKNCEPVTIHIEGKSEEGPQILFRNLKLELPDRSAS